MRSPFNDERLQKLDSKKISGYKQNLELLYKDLNESKTLSKNVKVNCDAPTKQRRIMKEVDKHCLNNPAILSRSTAKPTKQKQKHIIRP